MKVLLTSVGKQQADIGAEGFFVELGGKIVKELLSVDVLPAVLHILREYLNNPLRLNIRMVERQRKIK